MTSRKIKVIALSMGKTLTTLVGIITAMVLSRIFDKTDYATYRQTLLAFMFVMPFLSLGMVNSINYFLPTENERPKGVVNDAVFSLFIMGFLFSLFLLLGGNKLLALRFNNPAIEETLLYLIPKPIVVLPATLLAVVLVIRDKVKVLTYFNIISRGAIGISIICAALIAKTVNAALIVNVTMTVLSGIIAIYLINKYSGKGSVIPSLKNVKAMLVFGFPLGLATMLGTIIRQLDKVIVSSMATPVDFSIYVNGAMELPLVGIITGSITAVILPDLRRMIAEKNNKQALKLFKNAMKKSAAFIIPVFLFLIVTADSFIVTLYSDKYAASAVPFRLYLLILPVRIVQFGAVLMSFGKNKIILYQTIMSLFLNLILSVILVRQIGYLGAVVATLFVIYSWALTFNIFYLKKLFAVSFSEIIPIKTIIKENYYLIIPTLLILVLELNKTLLPQTLLRFSLQAMIYILTAFFLNKKEFLKLLKN